MLLNDMQSLFKDTLLDRTGIHPSTEFGTLFTAADNSLSQRLAIYRGNVLGSLTNALLATYPLIVTLTGNAFSINMFRNYILQSPPQNGSLAHYGADMDIFIEHFAPAKDLPYLCDVARMEWAMNQAYYAPDDTALTAEQARHTLTSKEPSSLKLILHSSVFLLESAWPLLAIRDFCLKYAQGSDATLDLDQKGGLIMVCRKDLSVELFPLDPAAFALLTSLQQKNLGDALEAVLASHPDFDFQIFLQKHLALETFSAFGTNS